MSGKPLLLEAEELPRVTIADQAMVCEAECEVPRANTYRAGR